MPLLKVILFLAFLTVAYSYFVIITYYDHKDHKCAEGPLSAYGYHNTKCTPAVCVNGTTTQCLSPNATITFPKDDVYVQLEYDDGDNHCAGSIKKFGYNVLHRCVFGNEYKRGITAYMLTCDEMGNITYMSWESGHDCAGPAAYNESFPLIQCSNLQSSYCNNNYV